MIDLFYPAHPTAFRRGRVVALFTPAKELMPKVRRQGRDLERAAARQARYRARMRSDVARHRKHIEACREWYAANRDYAIAYSRARRARGFS